MSFNEAEIILIEDNIYDAELILLVMQQHKIANKIIVLKDGVEAINYFFGKDRTELVSEFPKLVLLDLKLPKSQWYRSVAQT